MRLCLSYENLIYFNLCFKYFIFFLFSYTTFPSSSGEDPLPDSFDWRNNGTVTSVKNQGTAGTCWAFSTVENIEGQWVLGGNNLTSLAPEQLVDCDDNYDPNKSVIINC